MSTCAKCGRDVSATAAFCPACGTPNPEAPDVLAAAAGEATQLLEQSALAKQLQEALGGNFLVENEIGEGGFAHVFSVADRKLSRQIAVKVLRPEFTGSRSSVQRFIREAESAAKLNHPNILSIFFVGEGQGLVYFGMPMVHGESLDARLRREGQLPESEVVRIGGDIADALAEAHGQSLVHRDVKPQNVMLQGAKQRVLVADFGIAKAAAGSGERLTGTGVIIGSPHYMSPEQASGAPDVDARSDIYSLGVVLWEMLAGEVPFDGPSTQGILIQHLTKAIPAIKTKRPTVSAQLAKVVARCTEKKPSDRFQTAGELADALRACAASAAAVAGAEHRGPRLPRPVLLGAAAVVVAAAGFLLWRGLGSRTAGTTGTATEGAHSNAARLAVLPFEVSGTDSSLGRSVAQLLTDGVTQRYSVPTVDGRDLLGRWSAGKRQTTAPLADNGTFAYGLGANQMVIGNVVGSGTNLRLSVDVYDTHDLTHLVHGDETGNRDSLFGLVDRLAARVATAMCTQPEFNPAKLCFDTPARPTSALSVTDVPQPGETPATAPSFFVWVDSSGQVSDVRVRTASTHEDINAYALAAARQADYQPATKAGKPVGAWAEVTVAVRGGAARAVELPAMCRNPGSYPARACFDTRPVPLALPTLPWHGQGTPPTPPTFWVRVSDAGVVLDVKPIATSSDAEFSVAALNAAKDYKFTPAQKGGRPVDAWTQIAISPAQ